MVFLNTVLCSFLNGLRVGSYGFVAGIVWVTTLVTRSLLLAGQVWVSISPDRTEKSWLVSANNDNPFLMASNWFRVVQGPILDK